MGFDRAIDPDLGGPFSQIVRCPKRRGVVDERRPFVEVRRIAAAAAPPAGPMEAKPHTGTYCPTLFERVV
jgi:hypothetical protein